MAQDEAYRKAEKKIEEALRTGAKTLYLSWDYDQPKTEKLTELPKSLGQLTQLESLNLGEVRMTDFGANGLGTLTELRTLDLSQTQITSKALEVVAKLPKLERLSLWRAARIDDNGGAHIAAMRNLTILDLGETRISDVVLEQLQSAKRLRKLYLRGSKVTASGVDAFRQSNPNCEVSWN